MQEKTARKSIKMPFAEVLSKYVLLFGVLSFIGWVFESAMLFYTSGSFVNTGFMTLPFCPIYGCSLILVYFLIGTPDEGRGILKEKQNPYVRYATYLALAFLIPTAAELAVGFFFDFFFDTWLWSYNGMPLNFHGYIALPVSLAWMVLIFLFMKYLFSPIKRFVFKISKTTAIILAGLLVCALAVDMTLAYIKI